MERGIQGRRAQKGRRAEAGAESDRIVWDVRGGRGLE